MAAVIWDDNNKGTNLSLSNGGKTVLISVDFDWSQILATLARSEGRWYFEVDSISSPNINHNNTVGVQNGNESLETYIGDTVDGWGYQSNGRYYNSGQTSGHPSWSSGGVVMVAVDLDNNTIWFGLNGTWDGLPGVSGEAFSNLSSGDIYPAVSPYHSNFEHSCHFAKTDQVYAAPSGFLPWDSEPYAFENVKSIVIDVEANYTDPIYLGFRSMDFYLFDVLHTFTSSDIKAYATTEVDVNFSAGNAFITSLSKTGAASTNSWSSSANNITNQRLICVFNDSINFDKIIYNNYHNSGGDNDRGIEFSRVYLSPYEITDVTYGNPISGSVNIFKGLFENHIASDVIENRTIALNTSAATLSGGASSSSSSSSSSLSSSSSSSSSSLSSSSSSSSLSSSSSSSSSSMSSSSSSSLSSSSLSSSSSSLSSSSNSISSSSSSSYFDSSRIHFWHYVLNEGGQPIQNAEVRLYLNDDPTTEANIYLNELGSSYTTCSVADIKTDNNGFFEFWLANEFEDGGYAYTQQFRLEWYKAGTKPGVIENINPWPNAFAWEKTNIGIDRDHRNKFVSDFLATKWWTHANAIVPSASPHDLHPVEFDTCGTGRYNKVVSNKYLNDIIQYSIGEDSETLPSGGVAEYQQNITSWVASGSAYYIDIDNSSKFDTRNCTIQISKLDDKRQFIPKKIINLTPTIKRIIVDDEVDSRINIQGVQSSSSSSTSSSSSSLSSSSSSSSSSTSSSSSSSNSSSSSSSSISSATVSFGLSKLNDNEFSVMDINPLMIDSDIETAALSQPLSTGKNSVGIAYAVTGTPTYALDVYCAVSATSDPQLGFDQGVVQAWEVKESDNNSTWSLIAFNGPSTGQNTTPTVARDRLPCIYSAPNVFAFRLFFMAVPPTKQYIKLYAADSATKSVKTSGELGGPYDIYPTEVRAVPRQTQFPNGDAVGKQWKGWSCILYPEPDPNGYTLTNNNRTVEATIGSQIYVVHSKFQVTPGKWYWELVADNLISSGMIGFGQSQSNARPGFDGSSWGWSLFSQRLYHSGSIISGSPTVSFLSGDIMMFAVDCDNQKWYFGKNGIWQGSGDPVTGVNPISTDIKPNSSLRAGMSGQNGCTWTANFNAANMIYTIPSGYMAPVED